MQADIIWLGVGLMVGLLSFWTITLGFLVKWPIVKWILKTNWLNGLIATAILNIASLIIGNFLTILSTLFMAKGLTILLNKWMLNLNGQLIFWVLAFFITVFITAGIEALALTIYCKTKLFKKTGLAQPSLSRIWGGLTIANLLSVTITYLFIYFTMIRPIVD